jgi:hypothetical protein
MSTTVALAAIAAIQSIALAAVGLLRLREQARRRTAMNSGGNGGRQADGGSNRQPSADG